MKWRPKALCDRSRLGDQALLFNRYWRNARQARLCFSGFHPTQRKSLRIAILSGLRTPAIEQKWKSDLRPPRHFDDPPLVAASRVSSSALPQALGRMVRLKQIVCFLKSGRAELVEV